MTETSLKYRTGWFLVLLHILIMLLLISFYVAGGFSFDQLTTVLAIIVPMFAGYTTAIVTFIVNDRYAGSDHSKAVSSSFIAMSFLFPGIFAVLIVGAICLQAFTLTFENFEQFKQALILVESLFAAYVGRFIYTMFHRPHDGSQSPAPSALKGYEKKRT